MVSPANMSADFTVSILYSNDLSSASPSVNATYAEFTGSSSTTNVAAPNYTASFGSLVVQTILSAYQ